MSMAPFGMRSVLVTGGTGFLGKAVTKELLRRGCERVCIYSRGEFAQAKMRQELEDDSRLRWFIGDVRDKERLGHAMEGVEGVIHGAALKRIEVGVYNPYEMVKTNVVGSQNVIEAAHGREVRKVLLVSSDKAFEPVSPYGQTKALAESLFLSANAIFCNTAFSVVRYGNVWNSTGSVLPTWKDLIACGKKVVPVTSKGATRFFMRISQAVNLVLDTLDHMKGGEVAVPTLPAYAVGDLVKALGVESTEIGLPEHEKLHESMKEGLRSNWARRMTVEELRGEIEKVS